MKDIHSSFSNITRKEINETIDFDYGSRNVWSVPIRIENDDGYVNFIMCKKRQGYFLSVAVVLINIAILFIFRMREREKQLDKKIDSPTVNVVRNNSNNNFLCNTYARIRIYVRGKISVSIRARRERERERKKVYNIITTIYSVLPSLSSFSCSLYIEEQTCTHMGRRTI